MVDTVRKHFLDFRQELIFDPIEVQTLQLNHAIAMATGEFLNPVAYSKLAILDFIMQGTLDKRPLDFHVALHIERHAISTDKLL